MAEHEADRGQGRDPEDGEAVAAADSGTGGSAPGTASAGSPSDESGPAGPEAPGKSETPDATAVAKDAEPEATGTSAFQSSTAPVTPPVLDEAAAWQAIVSGYGEEPADPPGAAPFRPVHDLPLGDSFTFSDTKPSTSGRDTDQGSGSDGDGRTPAGTAVPSPDDGDKGSDATADTAEPGSTDRTGSDNHPSGPGGSAPLGGSVTFAPGLGPRDHTPPRDPDETDDAEGFTPPEPPPLPESDATTRFAWLGMLGGPVLLLVAVILGWEMTWWLTTACVGGFLGGCATLVMRMDAGDDEDDDPGRGAVV